MQLAKALQQHAKDKGISYDALVDTYADMGYDSSADYSSFNLWNFFKSAKKNEAEHLQDLNKNPEKIAPELVEGAKAGAAAINETLEEYPLAMVPLGALSVLTPSLEVAVVSKVASLVRGAKAAKGVAQVSRGAEEGAVKAGGEKATTSIAREAVDSLPDLKKTETNFIVGPNGTVYPATSPEVARDAFKTMLKTVTAKGDNVPVVNSLEDLDKLLKNIIADGKDITGTTSYKGKMWELPNGIWVGSRGSSATGAARGGVNGETIDIFYRKNGETMSFDKVHIK